MAAQQCRDALATRRKRNIGPVRLRVVHQHVPYDGVASQDRSSRLLQLSGICLGGFYEILHRLVGRVSPHDHEAGLQHQAGHGSELVDRKRSGFLHEPVCDPHTRINPNSVAVAGLLTQISHGAGATAPGPIDDGKVPRKHVVLLQGDQHSTNECIVAAAGAGMNDDFHGSSRRKLLSGGSARSGHNAEERS